MVNVQNIRNSRVFSSKLNIHVIPLSPRLSELTEEGSKKI